MLFSLLVACLPLSHSVTQQQTSLNAQTSSQNGVSISANPECVSISGSNFIVDVNTQDAYDLKISLNNSWGFDTLANSSLTLTLDGDTPYPDNDADLLFVFAVNDLQYFSFFLHLDTNNLKSRIYPSLISDKNTQNVSQWISDTSVMRQRWHRISNNDEWIIIDSFRDQAVWPLQFVITNDPIQKHSTFAFYHQEIPTLAVQYAFNATFVCDQDSDIYIMGDSKNEEYIVSSVDIVLTKQEIITHEPITTINPTLNPTKQPLIIPTEAIISVPTHIATLKPTGAITTDIPSTSSSPITTRVPTFKPTIVSKTPTQSVPITTRRTTTEKPSPILIAAAPTIVKHLYMNTTDIHWFDDTKYVQISADVDRERNNGYLVVFVIMVGCAVMAVLLQLYRIIRSKRKHKDIDATKSAGDGNGDEEIAVAMEHNEYMDNKIEKERETKTDRNTKVLNMKTGTNQGKYDGVLDDTLTNYKSSDSKHRENEMSSTTEQYEIAHCGRRTEMMRRNTDTDITLASKLTDIMRKRTESNPYRKETESVFYEPIQRPSVYDYEGKYEETDNDIENTVITASNQQFMGSPTINRYWNNHIKADDADLINSVQHRGSVSSLF